MTYDKGSRPPRYCPACGQDLSEFPYYQPSLSPAARAIRRFALLLMPIMGLAYLGWLFWGGGPDGFGTGHGYFAVMVVCAPSLLLFLVTRLFPRRRLVICLHCSWNEEFPPAGHPQMG